MSPDDEQITALVTGVQILSELFWGPNLQKCHKIISGTYFQPFATLESALEFNPPDVLQRIESALNNFTDPDSWGKAKRIKAEDVIHRFETLRPGQLRGISPFASAILIAHDLGEYIDATARLREVVDGMTIPDVLRRRRRA